METNKDIVMMKDGKMVILRQGKLLPMDLDMALLDGTRVMTTGAIMRPDGTSRQMLEGEAINMEGEMTNIDDEAYVNDTKDVDDMTRMVD